MQQQFTAEIRRLRRIQRDLGAAVKDAEAANAGVIADQFRATAISASALRRELERKRAEEQENRKLI